ncbi:prepilin-type N-terminal cleavage/methylation domain-containing protein [Opitutales bacterium]|nr:prepilin-type N-terminal cleavage/methylation domain-containing protein [Opitutales bacterium]
MNYFKKGKGFTLIEVVIALAIFGMLIGGLLGFLPWGVEGVGKVKDRSTAHGMVDAIQLELERLGFSLVEAGTKRLSGLYNATDEPEDLLGTIYELALVANKVGGKVSFEGVYEREQTRAGSSGKLVQTRTRGGNVASLANDVGGIVEFDRYQDLPVSLIGLEQDFEPKAMNRWISQNDRYFLIICRQFAKFPGSTTDPPSRHYHHPSNGFLALQVEVQWPYKVPGSSSEGDFIEVEERFRSKFEFPLAISR